MKKIVFWLFAAVFLVSCSMQQDDAYELVGYGKYAGDEDINYGRASAASLFLNYKVAKFYTESDSIYVMFDGDINNSFINALNKGLAIGDSVYIYGHPKYTLGREISRVKLSDKEFKLRKKAHQADWKASKEYDNKYVKVLWTIFAVVILVIVVSAVRKDIKNSKKQ